MLSRVRRWFVGTPDEDVAKPTPASHSSRHDRRAAGRKRHHATGEPAWEAQDRVDQGAADAKNPDAAPEILGGG